MYHRNYVSPVVAFAANAVSFLGSEDCPAARVAPGLPKGPDRDDYGKSCSNFRLQKSRKSLNTSRMQYPPRCTGSGCIRRNM